jgi:hypothetical protein
MSKNPYEIKKSPEAIVSAQAINLDDFVSKANPETRHYELGCATGNK